MDDMIAVFLKAEITSVRFGDKILTQLQRDHKVHSIVEKPDITNASDNVYRRQLLAGYRAYVFEELPAHTAWYRALLTRDEVTKIRYIDYDYWNEISDSTRLPSVAAQAIRAGVEIYGESTQGFLEVAQALRSGIQVPELILVSTAPDAVLTVYEGHLRLTAYLLAPAWIPAEVEVIIGFAPECATI